MLGSLLLEAAIIFVLIVANGFFASSEIAIVSARKGRLKQQAEQGRHGAAVALQLAENPNHFLSTVQVGISLIGTFAAAFGGASIAELLELSFLTVPSLAPYAAPLSLGIVVLAITYFSLIIGELVPKRLALQQAEGVAQTVAPIMAAIARLASPLVRFLTFSTEVVLRLLGRHNVPETSITEDDVLALVREGTEEGSLETTEEELILNVFSMTDRTVRSLMTPRTRIAAIEPDTPLLEILHAFSASSHAHLPVYQDSLDNVIGILPAKALLPLWGQTQVENLQPLLRPVFYVLEHQRAIVAFQQMEQHRAPVAMVLDEYGQVAGLITANDILAELVDKVALENPAETFVRRDDGSYLVDGLLPFEDLQDRLHLPKEDVVLRDREFETVAGFLLVLFGRVPSAGDKVNWRNYTFEVVDMDQRRIDKAIVYPPEFAARQSEGALATKAVLPLPDTQTHSSAQHETDSH